MPVRVYERAGEEDGDAPRRFKEIDAARELLRPGSLVVLCTSAGDEALAVRRSGGAGGEAQLQLAPTGWSSRAVNGNHTYALAYAVDSLLVEAVMLVVRDGSMVGFSALGAEGRMVAPGGGEQLQLSMRTPATWGSTEAWQHRDDGALVNVRRPHVLLGFTPLHVTALPTLQLQLAEEHWGKQVFEAESRCKDVEQALLSAQRSSEAWSAEVQRQSRALASAEQLAAEARRSGMRWEAEAEEKARALRELQVAVAEADASEQAASSWPRDAQDDALAGLRQQHAAEQEALRAQHAEQEQRLVEQHAQQLRAKNAELHELQEEHAKLHLSLQIMKDMISLAKSASKANSGSQDASPEAVPAFARSATIEKLAAASSEAPHQQLFQAPRSPPEQQQPPCAPCGDAAGTAHEVAAAEASCPGPSPSESDAESVHKLPLGHGTTHLVDWSGTERPGTLREPLQNLLDAPLETSSFQKDESPRPPALTPRCSAATSPAGPRRAGGVSAPASISKTEGSPGGDWCSGCLSLPGSTVVARSAPREALLPAENLVTALGAASPNEAQHIADFLAAPLPLAVSMSQPTGAIRGLKLADKRRGPSRASPLRQSAPAGMGLKRSNFLSRPPAADGDLFL